MISRQCSFGKRTDTEINVTEYTQETDRDVKVMQWKKNSLFNTGWWENWILIILHSVQNLGLK